MTRIAFYGDIAASESRPVSSVLTNWLDRGPLNGRERMFGYELTYEDESTYLYCHEAATAPGRPTHYLIEGTLDGDESESVANLKQLINLCASSGLSCEIDYMPVDSEGEPVGAEVTMTTRDSSK
ncbi:hypothetical protein ACFVUS_25985 [Nocardia sp. NPDC058058]|uniref:hypothetical protein n=1 Tax=Nocardia sp. NPDC058058 TaxID=3346317 RepID=UPI0036DB0C50